MNSHTQYLSESKGQSGERSDDHVRAEPKISWFTILLKFSNNLTGSWTELLGYAITFQVHSIGFPDVHINRVCRYNRFSHDDIGEADRNSRIVLARDAEYTDSKSIASMPTRTSGTYWKLNREYRPNKLSISQIL